MTQTNTLSLKENPQFCIDFMADATQIAQTGQTFVTWIVISKLQLVHTDGFQEEAESQKDYIAMHVYNNSNKGQKVLEDRNCIQRETYSPAQTVMLYLELNSAEHLTQTNVMNLVLDQHKRERDLYYNIRVFSQVPFSVNRSTMNFKHTQTITVPPCAGGGVPSSPLFYQNPQFLISCDRSKIVNWATASKVTFDTLFSYTTTDSKTHIKTFLCHSTAGNYRISTINDETVVHMAQKKEPYKPQTNHVRFMLKPENFYTLVLSSFEKGRDLGGTLTIESNQPLSVRTIGAEGQGMFM